MKDDFKNSKRMYNNALNKSVGEDKVVKYVKMPKDKYISNLKKTFIVGSIAAIILTSSLIYGGYKAVDTVQENIIVSKQVEKGIHMVNQNTKRTADNQHFYYENYDIAEELVNDPENFDKNLYGVYKAIGYNKTSQLEQIEDVVSKVGNIVSSTEEDLGIKHYQNFTDYCAKKGFVNEDGTIDLDAYEEGIKNQIVSEEEIKNLKEEVENFKAR